MRRWLTVAMVIAMAASAGIAAAAGEQHGQHGSAMAVKSRPALAVGAAHDPRGVLWVTGLDDSGHLFIQPWDAGQKAWGKAQVLDVGSDVISADGENRPKIAFGPDHVAVISYTQPLSRPYTGEIRLVRSDDDGRSFSAPRTVHEDRQIITHRFDSILFDANGKLHVVWIDKRDQVQGGKYRGAAIYRTESADGGLTFGADTKVADHSCECCRIALAVAPEGTPVALWRHVFEPNIRDHAFASLTAGTRIVRATQDNWKLDACPHHGPGLARSASGGYHAVWFGERNGVMGARYGRLKPDGQAAGKPVNLPDNQAEHADVASLGSKVAIVWRSFDGQQTRLRAWVSADDGAHFDLRELSSSKQQNDHPRMVTGPQGISVVWRTRDEISVFPITF